MAHRPDDGNRELPGTHMPVTGRIVKGKVIDSSRIIAECFDNIYAWRMQRTCCCLL